MGSKGSRGKAKAIRFPNWMSEAINEIAQIKKIPFSDVVIELLRQELKEMGYSLGIGREAVMDEATAVTLKKEA